MSASATHAHLGSSNAPTLIPHPTPGKLRLEHEKEIKRAYQHSSEKVVMKRGSLSAPVITKRNKTKQQRFTQRQADNLEVLHHWHTSTHQRTLYHRTAPTPRCPQETRGVYTSWVLPHIVVQLSSINRKTLKPRAESPRESHVLHATNRLTSRSPGMGPTPAAQGHTALADSPHCSGRLPIGRSAREQREEQGESQGAPGMGPTPAAQGRTALADSPHCSGRLPIGRSAREQREEQGESQGAGWARSEGSDRGVGLTVVQSDSSRELKGEEEGGTSGKDLEEGTSRKDLEREEEESERESKLRWTLAGSGRRVPPQTTACSLS